MKLTYFFIAVISCFSVQAADKIDINTNWFFCQGDTIQSQSNTWSKVSLPHTFNPSGSSKIYREQKEELRYTGIGWYKKSLFINKEYQNKRLFLRFDGAYIDTDVFINGKKIGNHQGGYTAFVFEITDYVNYNKENLIAVKVNNAYNADITPLGGGYVKFGGITRPVWLEVKENLCISPLHYASTGVYCKPSNISKKKRIPRC